VSDAIAEIAKKHPQRFFGLMVLPLHDMEASQVEMERCANRLGMKGILLYSNLDGAFPDEERFRPIFDQAQRLDLPVLLHPAYRVTFQQKVYGSNGMVQIGRWDRHWGFKMFDKSGKQVQQDIPTAQEGNTDPESHQKNFVECARSRKLPNGDISVGHVSAIHSHLANIVARTGRNVHFDAENESIIGDSEANLLVKRAYRTHWGTPKPL